MGEASRMTQYKDKSSKGENISVGLFTYPMLMASDILLYDADYVPTGIDQKQHVELCRDLALRFNNKYGETFKIPQPMIPEMGAKIMDLQNPTKKMSKSEENPKGVILLLDDEKTIRKKIMSAVTDSDATIYYDPEQKPGISNLLTIYASLKEITIEETLSHFKDYNYGNLKKEVADIVVEKLTSIQTRYNEIINSDELDKILDDGKNKTIEIAKKKYEEVITKMGLGR
jgi:tryptophanyl-tRNA synthetase